MSHIKKSVKIDTLCWILENDIVNEKGDPIDMGPDSPHFFLEAIYEDISDEIAVQKPSQIGVSTWAILTELHDARFLGINQIHTLPAAKDVNSFVPSKVNEIIKKNPSIKKGLEKKQVDAVAQKQFGKGFLYYKGTKGDSDTLMLSSDRNWYDELDASDMIKIGAYESRMEAEKSLRQKRYISTPTMPGQGINKKIEESDQKHWRFKCDACKTEQHMVWPDNVDFEKKRYICSKCAEPITEKMVRAGGWKARYPDRTPNKKKGKTGISGYILTQMVVPWIKCSDLIKSYEDAKAGRNDMTMQYFYNHKLGLPYIEAAGQFPSALITQNCIDKEHIEVNSCMGVDVQLHELYIMVGSEEGIYGILKTRDDQEFIDTNGKQGKSKWDKWEELMTIYDVRYCVIDGGFTPNEVIAHAKKYPGKVWVNWYKEDPKREKIIRWSDEDFQGAQKDEEAEIKVLTDRERAIDWLLSDLKQGEIRFFYQPTNPVVKALTKQFETTYSRIVTDRLGRKKREWVSTGQDDWFHATIYFKIAKERKRSVEN